MRTEAYGVESGVDAHAKAVGAHRGTREVDGFFFVVVGHGFDDDAAPMAMIGIDGRFKELNPSFCRLVGYQEHEFAKAAWPSPHDRQLYVQQQEQFDLAITGQQDAKTTLDNVAAFQQQLLEDAGLIQ